MIGRKCSRSALGSAALGAVLIGCAAPRGQVAENRQQILTLRAELAQTKDQATKLSTQNREITARAVEDARRITALEDANEALEESVIAYQRERDQYAAALREIKTQMLASANSNRPLAMRGPLEQFSTDHPPCRYIAESGLLLIREGDLFAAGSGALTEEGEALIDDLGSRLISISGEVSVRIAADLAGNRVIRTSTASAGGDLGRMRVEAVRGRLSSASRIDPERISAAIEEGGATASGPSGTIRIGVSGGGARRPGA